MSFVRNVWGVLVGVKDALVLVFMLLFFLGLFALLSARPSPGQVREGALLIDLDGYVVEERSPIDPVSALLSGTAPVGEYPSRDLIRALDAAAKDDRVKAVVLDLTTFLGGGQVHLAEIGAAMDRVRAAKKPVLTYALGYNDDHLALASHASEVWLDPQGLALVSGPGGTSLYYAGLLEKLSINARIYRAGEFKAAVEPFSRTSMSDEARQNLGGLYGALWEEWQANVKKARPKADLARVTGDPVGWINASGGDLARAALAAGLVDKLGDKTQFGARVAQIAGKDSWSEKPGAYASSNLEAYLADTAPSRDGKAIGVVTIAGEIVDGGAGPGTAGGTRIADILDEALDDDLAGLVVRVDSPGGSVTASEEIRRAIQRFRDRKIPVAVSMGNVAASGGYWVSMPGERIFAQPQTITGSIGVFAVVPTFEKAAERVGVGVDGIRTTPLSGQPDFVGGFTPEMDAILQATVGSTYSDFLNLVSQRRGIPVAQLQGIAEGRVWDGGTARQLKLVDEFGGLDDALAWAAARAGAKEGEWHPVFLGEQAGEYDSLIRQIVSDGTAPSGRVNAGDLFALTAAANGNMIARVAHDAERLMQARGMQALCLECAGQIRSSSLSPMRSQGLAAFLEWLGLS